ncbi:MAG: lytic transglycosylase domain-containing protein [Candidatus Omnitrophota bacterium]
MSVKGNYKKIFGSLLIITAISIAATINVSMKSHENRMTINTLNEKINHLKHQPRTIKPVTRKEKTDFDTYKDTVFEKKYPEFSKIATIVYHKSKKYGFDPYMIMGLIQFESNFNPYAVSQQGAYGLMQVHYATWKDRLAIDFSRIFDAEYNIDLGLKVLDFYYKKCSNKLLAALCFYNGYKLRRTSNVKTIQSKLCAFR